MLTRLLLTTVYILIVLIFQMTKLRPRKAKISYPTLIAAKWHSQDLNSGT